MKTVPRIGRLMDLAGLLLFVAGGALYARAWAGFQQVPTIERPEGGAAFSMVELANGYSRIQNTGATLMLFGVAVFVVAWWTARDIPRAEASGSGSADRL